MYLDYVELENYRPYYGKQRINFGFDDNKNLTVILAENGSGKSTFVNGITWCLFGDEKHDDREKTEPLYNKIMAEELESEDFTSLNVNITIRFFDIINNEKKYFTVFRNEEYNNWGNSWEKSTQHLTIETFDGSVYKDDMAQYKIIGTIPEDMFQYFFFNGASLNNYFNENSKLNLKESIYNISQLDIISNVQKHIKGCLDKYNADYKKLSNNPEKNYNGLINNLNKQKSAKENEQKDNYKQIDEAINNIKMCDLELDNVDISEVDTLTSDRENIQKELKKSQSDYNEIYEKYEKKIIQLYPLVVLFDELSKAYEITHNAKQKKTAPPKVEIELLRDILSDGICICGTDINEHEECIKILTDRLNNTSNVTKDDFYEYYYLFQEKLKELYSIHDIDDMKNSLNSLKESISLKKDQLNDISQKLSNMNEAKIKRLENERVKNINIRDRLRKDNERLSKDIEKLDSDMDDLKDEREKQNVTNSKARSLNKKILFTEDALEKTKSLSSDVEMFIRNKVNENTKQQFTKINWKNDKYTDVILNEDYSINIAKYDEYVTPNDLSDGEVNLLALSFMMALHSLIGFEIPIFIDAPFENLDTNKRLDFVQGLHAFTSNKQIVFLLTDSQYTSDVKSAMKSNVFNEYQLIPLEKNKTVIKNE